MNTNILVLDAVMGSGKTNRLIEMMSNTDRPIIYIAPLLSECHRIAGTLIDVDDKGDEFLITDEYGVPVYQSGHKMSAKMFHHPNTKNSKGSKLECIKDLVKSGRNVVSTHQLFKLLDQDFLEIVRDMNYLLVIDEVLTVWSKFSLHRHLDESELGMGGATKTDKEVLQLIKNGFIEVCPLGILHWQTEKYDPENTVHEEVKRLCDMKQLSLSRGKVVFWEMTKELIGAFDDVWIATYMYHSSYMSHYLRMHGFNVRVERFGVLPSTFKPLIEVVDGKINSFADKPTALSYSSFVGRGVLVDDARKALDTFFRYAHKTSPEDRLWTCFKGCMPKLAGRRYRRSWLPFSTKATNQYAAATCVAYICNNYGNAFLLDMLRIRGEDFDQDMWALSEMLQWIWRSAIRNGEPIKLFVPSSRMRKLLQAWLNDEFTPLNTVNEDVALSDECVYDQLQMPETVWDGLEVV